ncbi:hypothetical protein FRB94_014252 [Tulasnella sp. JGI-2019a]|nr:hypothetical protein FRB93_005399 [Tulasnella sp. JGI-2019a]KAG9014159.1 hypothetical protein FRB94_014252 [Tulasnella sp. JGI-2019a]
MFIPIKAVSVLIAFAAVGFTSPTPELAPRAGITVSISSTSNFCMVVPNTPHTNIGVSEHPGGMTSYCSPGKIPSNFWTRPTFKRGTGVHGKAYVQRK